MLVDYKNKRKARHFTRRLDASPELRRTIAALRGEQRRKTCPDASTQLTGAGSNVF
jgi:hypothetical protein